MSTTTTRLGLYKTASDGSEYVNVVTDLLNNLDAIDLNIGYRDCTSSTRPSTVWKGLPIRESDTGRLYVSNGTAPASASWVEIPSAGAAVLAAMTFSGALALNSTLTVTGAVVLNSTLRAVGATSLNSTLAVTGATTLGSTLGVTGIATLSSNLSVAGSAAVTGNASITGNLTVSGIGQTQIAYKTADESVTSSTALQNDDHLSCSTVANAKYVIDSCMQFTGAAGGDLKIDWTIPSGATMNYAMLGTGSANFTDHDCSVVSNSTARTARGNGATPQSVNARGYLETGANAGTLQLRFAQGTSSGTATTMKQGSWIRVTRVA